jgi:hypothetical protein
VEAAATSPSILEVAIPAAAAIPAAVATAAATAAGAVVGAGAAAGARRAKLRSICMLSLPSVFPFLELDC